MTVLLKTKTGKLKSVNSIGIAVCTRNRPESLYRLLRSLVKYRNRVDSYVVIDDISQGQLVSPPKIINIIGPAKLQYLPVKFNNISRSRNKALEVCTENIMVFFDDDTEVKTNIIGRVKYNFLHHPKICAFTPTVLPTDQNNLSIIFSHWINPKGFQTCQHYTPIINSSGACFSINLKLVKQKHIHFPYRIQYSSEDIIFFHYLHRHHLVHWYDPKMVVYHHFDILSPLQTYLRFYSYGRDEYNISKYYNHLFSHNIDWMFPRRLLDYIFLPVFFIKIVARKTDIFINDSKILRKYYFQTVLINTLFVFGAYTNYPFLKNLTLRIAISPLFRKKP